MSAKRLVSFQFASGVEFRFHSVPGLEFHCGFGKASFSERLRVVAGTMKLGSRVVGVGGELSSAQIG